MSQKLNVIGTHFTGVLSFACLISDGKLVYGYPEERFSRIKDDSNFPILTIKHILKKFNLKLNDEPMLHTPKDAIRTFYSSG